jgi:hypothetical protein
MASLTRPIKAYSDSNNFPPGNHSQSQMVLIESQTGSIHLMLFSIFLVSAKHFHHIPKITAIFDHSFILNSWVFITIDLSIDF